MGAPILASVLRDSCASVFDYTWFYPHVPFLVEASAFGCFYRFLQAFSLFPLGDSFSGHDSD